MGPLGRLNHFFWQYKYLFVPGLLFTMISAGFQITVPMVVRQAVDSIPRFVRLYTLYGGTPAQAELYAYFFVALVLFALVIIITGAHLFVSEVQWLSTHVLDVPIAIVALLIAPLATELPEKFNSVLWISRDKDTLALGNITGAMAFQGTLPVTLGIVFTDWDLSLAWGTSGFLNALSVVLAVVSGGILYLRARSAAERPMKPRPFLIGGLFYLVFIAVVVYFVLALGVTASGGH